MSPVAEVEGPPDLSAVPRVPIHFIPASAGETFALGALTIRIMEDGSNTGIYELLLSFPFARLYTS